jgi:hypothetical protein
MATNLYEDYATEFEGSTQKHEKIIGTPNHPIKQKFTQRKYVSYLKTQKWIWAKTLLMGTNQRNGQVHQHYKKMIETPNKTTPNSKHSTITKIRKFKERPTFWWTFLLYGESPPSGIELPIYMKIYKRDIIHFCHTEKL